MKRIRPWIILTTLFVTVMVVTTACRKTEQRNDQMPEQTGSSVENKFLNSHRTLNVTENTLVEFVKRVNSKTPFIEKTVEQIGYPRWDKAFKMPKGITVKKPTTMSKDRTNTSNGPPDYDTYCVPFVRESQNYVNASMFITASSSDTSIGYVCDWQYRKKPYGSTSVNTTAENHALFFMMMDNRTLGHKEFDITDKSLFSSPGSDITTRRIGIFNPNQTATEKKVMDEGRICIDWYTCTTPGWCSQYAANGVCNYETCGTFCKLIVCPNIFETTGLSAP